MIPIMRQTPHTRRNNARYHCWNKLICNIFVICSLQVHCVSSNTSNLSHRVIRIGTFGWVDTFALGVTNKLFGSNFKTSKNVTFETEIVDLPSGVFGTAMLLSQEIHLTFLGNTVFAWAISRGANLKTIYSHVTVGDGNEGCISTTNTASDGNSIKSPADLKGKIMGVPCTSSSHFLLYQLSQMFFTSAENSDAKVTVKCLKPTEMKQEIMNKKVDGVCVWNPYLQDLLQELPYMQRIWDFSDVKKWGYVPFDMLVGTETFLNDDDNKEIVDRIIRVLAVLDNDLDINKETKPQWKLSESKLLQTLDTYYPSGGVSSFLNGYVSATINKLLSCQEGYGNEFLFPECSASNLASVYEIGGKFAYAVKSSLTFFSATRYQKSIDMSFAYNIANYKYIKGTQIRPNNITMEILLKNRNQYNITKSNIKSNYTCRSSSRHIYCEGDHFDLKTWSFRVLNKNGRLALIFNDLSLDTAFEKVTIIQRSNNGKNITLGTFSTRQYDGKFSDAIDLKILPSILSFASIDGNDIIEVTYQSTASDSIKHSRVNLTIYDFDNSGNTLLSCDSSRFTSVGSCNGHGKCGFNREISATKKTCICDKGYYGMYCSQNSCFGTRIISVTAGNNKNNIIISNIFRSNTNTTDYTPNANCAWILTDIPSDTGLKLLLEFDIENYFDEVKIYENNVARTLQARFSGNSSINSKNNKHQIFNTFLPSIIVSFTSDSIIQNKGIAISYSATDRGAMISVSKCSKNSIFSKISNACICLPGWSGIFCTIPFCSPLRVVLQYHANDLNLQQFASQPFEKYDNGATCSWSIQPYVQTSGVRFYIRTFDVDASDSFRITFEAHGEKIVTSIKNDPDVYRQENCISGEIDSNLDTVPPCVNWKSTSIDYGVYAPHALCKLTCYLDIIGRTSVTKPWESININFQSDINAEAAGFSFMYSYLPRKTRLFRPNPVQWARSFITCKKENEGIPCDTVLHNDADVQRSIRVVWPMRIDVNPLSIRHYEIAAGVDNSKLRETSYMVEVLDPTIMLKSEANDAGFDTDKDYYVYDVSLANNETILEHGNAVDGSNFSSSYRVLKNTLQIGKTYWLSVTIHYVAFKTSSIRQTSLTKSPPQFAFPSSKYYEQLCIPPLIPISEDILLELSSSVNEENNNKLEGVNNNGNVCCDKDKYFQDDSLLVFTIPDINTMSDDQLVEYRVCKPCPSNVICQGQSYKLIKPKIGSWKVEWEEPNVAFRYLPCLNKLACMPTGCEIGYTGVLCGSCDTNYVLRGDKCSMCGTLPTFIASIITGIMILLCISLFSIFKTKDSKILKQCLPVKKKMKKYYTPLIAFLRLIKVIINFTQVTSVLSSSMTSSQLDASNSGNSVPSNFGQFASYFTVFNADIFTLLNIDCGAGTLSFFHKMVYICTVPYILLICSFLYDRKHMKGLKKKIKKGKNKSFKFKKIKKSFNYVDKDNNGRIDKSEFFLAVSNIKRMDTKDKGETDKIFDEVVKDQTEKTLTLDGFVSLIRNSKAGFNGQAYVNHMSRVAAKTKVYGVTVQLLIFLHTPITQKLLEFYKCIEVPTSGGSKYPPRFFLAVDTRFECYKDTWYFFLPFNIFFLMTFSIAVPLFMICILLYFRGKLQHLEVSDRFGYFYKRVKPGLEWWELLEIGRRFALTGIISLIPYEGAKMGVALLVSTLVLVSLNYFRPHNELMYFWMTNVCYSATVVLFISVTVISILSNSPEVEEIKDGIGIFLIIVHVVVFILMMVTLCIGTIDLMKKYKEAKDGNNVQAIEDNKIIELVADVGVNGSIHVDINEKDDIEDPNYHRIEAGNIDTNDNPTLPTEESIKKSTDFSIPTTRKRRKSIQKIKKTLNQTI